MEELQKLFEVMHVDNVERVKLVAYKTKGVTRIWYDQWKKSWVQKAPIFS